MRLASILSGSLFATFCLLGFACGSGDGGGNDAANVKECGEAKRDTAGKCRAPNGPSAPDACCAPAETEECVFGKVDDDIFTSKRLKATISRETIKATSKLTEAQKAQVIATIHAVGLVPEKEPLTLEEAFGATDREQFYYSLLE